MTYNDLYTAIGTALTGVNYTKYYTLMPDNPAYPHILIQIISDRPEYHKDAPGTAHVEMYRVQIEVRARDQAAVSTITGSVLAAMHAATAIHARKEATAAPMLYDAQERVYRSVNDYMIRV